MTKKYCFYKIVFLRDLFLFSYYYLKIIFLKQILIFRNLEFGKGELKRWLLFTLGSESKRS